MKNHFHFHQFHLLFLNYAFNIIFMETRANITDKLVEYKEIAAIPHDVNRLLFVRNLPSKVTSSQVYQLFEKFGPVYRIWIGKENHVKGSAYVMFASILDAKEAVVKLNNLKIGSRHLSVLFYNKVKLEKSTQARRRKSEVLQKQSEVFVD